MKKLTDICDIQYGYAFDSKKFTEDNSYPPIVRISIGIMRKMDLFH